MEKILFLGLCGFLIGFCGITVFPFSPLVGLGIGWLLGGVTGYLDGDFQKPSRPRNFIDVDRHHAHIRRERERLINSL